MRLAVLCLVAVACDNGGATPDWSRMITQPKLLPYGAAPQFADGRAMRPRPAGVVAIDRIEDPARRDGTTPGGVAVATIPLPITRALLERGRERFAIACAVCHGVAGDGESPVARAMQRRRPPSLHEPRIAALSPGAMYRVIVAGYGVMPAYATLLTVDDRWAVVAYVRTLELAWRAPLATLPTVRGHAGRGVP
ncbi:MAG: cytochrome c [Kofleriaceae bacterium]